MQTIKRRLYEDGLISIIRGRFSVDEQLSVAEALLKGGVGVLEVTLNTTGALEGVAALKERFAGDLLVGAGTVRSAEDVDRAVAAGAAFLVAPCLDRPSVERAAAHGVLLLPGIFTATEAQTAYTLGCETVKLFPADALGPGYLKALRAPLEHIDFIPTGGVSPETIGDFHRAGAVAFGVGSYLVKQESLDERALGALSERARRLKDALQDARG